MTDQNQEDHDLLIRIHAQLEIMQKQQETFDGEFKAHQEDTDKRFKSLEQFFTLARNGFAFLVALGALVQFSLLLYERAMKFLTAK